jgi:hypothetical protein
MDGLPSMLMFGHAEDFQQIYFGKESNRKQSDRWQHISHLKASAFCIWSNKLWWFKTQQLILGTGTAIWWVTEPHCLPLIYTFPSTSLVQSDLKVIKLFLAVIYT